MSQFSAKPVPAEFIQPPDTLRAKVGATFGGIDADAIARAEAALASLSSQFDGWLKDETDKLDAAHQAVHDQGRSPQSLGALYTCGHDLKGLGATYGFPLISRLAGSLCRLMDGPGGREKAPMFLIDAHVDAIRAVIRDDIREAEHPVGQALAEALETRVKDYAPADDKGAPQGR